MDFSGCIKFGVLFWFSVIFSVLGIIIVAIGAITQAVYFDDVNFVDFNFFSTPALLIVVGVIIFIIAFLGCCGAVKESHCMIMTFSILLSLLFVLELAGVIAAYAKRGEIENIVENRLNYTLDQYNTNNEIHKSWDIMQHELKCCGINKPEDWQSIGNKTIPSLCCDGVPVEDSTPTECSVTESYQEGCMQLLVMTLKQKAFILGFSAIGVAIVQISMICFTCALARSIRKDYQTV